MRTESIGHIAGSILLALLFATGLAISARPVVEDLLSSRQAQQTITKMSSLDDQTHDGHRMDMLREAQAFNLERGGDRAATDNDQMQGGNGGTDDILTLAEPHSSPSYPYEQQLIWESGDAICWVEIPKIDVSIPVYHGTDDATLAQGVGHLEWSSLPVGGLASHCVLAAHSGMQRFHMFDELEQLEAGDIFVLHTLGDAYAYAVYATETVLPEDAQQTCQIEEGRDLCTLVTCTPYGINSHRLLVHGERTVFDAQQRELVERSPVVYVNRRTRPFLQTCAATLGCLVAGIVSTRVPDLLRGAHESKATRRATPRKEPRRHETLAPQTSAPAYSRLHHRSRSRAGRSGRLRL